MLKNVLAVYWTIEYSGQAATGVTSNTRACIPKSATIPRSANNSVCKLIVLVLVQSVILTLVPVLSVVLTLVSLVVRTNVESH